MEGGRVSGIEGCPEKVVGCSLPLWEGSKREEWVGLKSHLSQRKQEPSGEAGQGPRASEPVLTHGVPAAGQVKPRNHICGQL